MTVSIITVVFNCKDVISGCLDSIQSQTYPYIEHIIIDGGSSDGTLKIISTKANAETILMSAADLGYYDALNKGIGLSTGKVIGVLSADDEFSSVNVIEHVVSIFNSGICEAAYGNLNYIRRTTRHSVNRRWREKQYNARRFQRGWMPAHPTLFSRSELFSLYGCYSLTFGSCADYDLIIRFLYTHKVKTIFTNELMVTMRSGGLSNGSFKKLVSGMRNDHRVLVSNHFRFSWLVVILKRLRKVGQLIKK
jgi:glycosyltransferase involved in cell wall biosynthesis